MNLEDLLKQRMEELARVEAAKRDLLEQLNRVERNIIALTAAVATIKEVQKGVQDAAE